MSTYQSAYPSLLQGVSQQLPFERLPGQVTAQVNMLSDPSTGVRRRPGTSLRNSVTWAGVTQENLRSWFVDIAGQRVHVYLHIGTGEIRLYSETWAELYRSPAIPYLVATNVGHIRETVVGDEMFLLNTERSPALVGGTGIDPKSKGFLYVVAGSFGRSYDLWASINGVAVATSYLTPNGQGAGDAALATPEYIATQLAAQLAPTFAGTIDRQGSYLFLRATDASATLNVWTTLGSLYEVASTSGTVTSVERLPASLPTSGDGYIVRVGNGNSAQYYRYDAAAREWLETGKYNSPATITNVPVVITNRGGWVVDTAPWGGRLAGDDANNPTHRWMNSGITGIGTHQGRLVLLSGAMASMSASGKSKRFFRTSVAEVLASDPIEIGSSTNSSASYEWAIPFNKDLICFSRGYQAVIPTGNTAITPSNATIVPTSGHEVDTTSSPIVIGRTAMYCSPRSEDFFGVLELVPSNFTSSQYISQEATPHLPKYLPGRCRFAVSSNVANLALFAPTGDRNTLVVHEYHWDGDTKAQQAWHKWTFRYPVATAYFATDLIVVVHAQNGRVLMTTIDPRAGFANSAGERRPYLDLATFGKVVNHKVSFPADLLAFDPSIGPALSLVASTGQLAGDRVGIESISGTEITTVVSQPNPDVAFGVPFRSSFVPSPPVIRDRQERVIHTDKATLLRMVVGSRGSSDYTATVSDAYSLGSAYDVITLTFSHPEIALGRALYADVAQDVVPCRTDLRTTALELFTAGAGEMNITSIEYDARYQPKIKRF